MSLFCDFVYFSTFFSCFTVFYLFPPPNTLLSCYYYQIFFIWCCYTCLSICHQDMWKLSMGSFLFIGIQRFFYPQCIPPVFTLMYNVKLILHTSTYHTEHVIILVKHLIMFYFVWAALIVLIWLSYLAKILGFWVTCGVKMMSLCHGWGWQPPQTASHIHIRHVQSAYAHWYPVHRHTVASLHSYTHPTRLRFWDSGSLMESKWCHYVAVEADSHLKLLPTSILNI